MRLDAAQPFLPVRQNLEVPGATGYIFQLMSALRFFSNRPYFIAVLVTLVMAALVVVGIVHSPPKDVIDIQDVVFEGMIALLAVAWIVIVHRSVEDRRIYVPLVVGFSLILGAYIKDLADEFVHFSNQYDLIEHLGSVAGMGTVGIGLVLWFRTLRRANARLETEVDARTADLKESNRKLESALSHKTVLVRELHHRVKNNLQVVESLLRLQRRSLPTAESRELIGRAYNRIRSIGAVHELLYTDVAATDRVLVQEYFGVLIENVQDTYGDLAEQITILLDCDAMTLDLDRAILCGLLLNELVTNALTHAFPNHEQGEIRVGFHRRGDVIEVSVRDNGIGRPEDLEPNASVSLGFRLVRAWQKQLRAEMTVEGKNGTAVALVFDAAVPAREIAKV